MAYTYWELAVYLIIYSFIGWVIEVAAVTIREKKFCNRGFLSMPLCVAYGIIMDILIVSLIGIFIYIFIAPLCNQFARHKSQ